MILKVLMIGFGIFLLIMDLFMYARQKLTDVIGLGWAIVSLALLVAGIVVSLDDVCYLWSGAKNIVLLMFAVFAAIRILLPESLINLGNIAYIMLSVCIHLYHILIFPSYRILITEL